MTSPKEDRRDIYRVPSTPPGSRQPLQHMYSTRAKKNPRVEPSETSNSKRFNLNIREDERSLPQQLIEPEVGVNGAVALTLSKDEIDDDEYKHAFESWRNLVKSCNDFGKEIENKRAQLKEDLKEFEAKKRRLTRFYGVVSEDLKSYEVDFQPSRSLPSSTYDPAGDVICQSQSDPVASENRVSTFRGSVAPSVMKQVIQAVIAKGTAAYQSTKGPLSEHDVLTLTGPILSPEEKGWVNDVIINGFLDLLAQKSDSSYLSTQFFTSLEKGPENVKGWHKSSNVLQLTRLFVPIQHEYHWTLLVVYPHQREIIIYDSMGPQKQAQSWGTQIQDWLSLQPNYLPDGWNISQEQNATQQTNANDCGVFVLTTAKRIAFGAKNPAQYNPDGIQLRWDIFREFFWSVSVPVSVPALALPPQHTSTSPAQQQPVGAPSVPVFVPTAASETNKKLGRGPNKKASASSLATKAAKKKRGRPSAAKKALEDQAIQAFQGETMPEIQSAMTAQSLPLSASNQASILDRDPGTLVDEASVQFNGEHVNGGNDTKSTSQIDESFL